MATPHIESRENEISELVLMPGDPLRAKYIADNFLEDVTIVNNVRNMTAYTGNYKGKRITVFPSGMGIPSMGIYSYELFKFYDVDTIIRIGSAGSYTEDLDLYEVLLVEGAFSESTFAKTQGNETRNILYSNKDVNNKIEEKANQLNIKLNKGIVHSSDVFYKENDNFKELHQKYGCCCVEMESFALYHNANVLGKKAACILTISDNLFTHKETTPEERQNSFKQMIELALESIE